MAKKRLVLFIDSVHPLLYEGLENAGYECIWLHDAPQSKIYTMLPEAEGVVLRSRVRIDSDFLAESPKLSWIARSGSGMENIDVEQAKKQGIRVVNAPEGNAPAVAEHVITLILSLFNKVKSGDAEVRKGKWNREANRGIEISGRTVGIIGYGHTGKATAKLLSALGAKVLAYDKYLNGFSDANTSECTLEEIKKSAEIISFHVPYNEETHYYFNSDFLKNCQKPIWLINTSRGKVIETTAVNQGIVSGAILGAGLDVLEFESSSFTNEAIAGKPEAFNELSKHLNVILTPHVAGWTVESYERLSRVLLEKIID